MKLYIQKYGEQQKKLYYLPDGLYGYLVTEIKECLANRHLYNFFVDSPGRSVDIDDFVEDILEMIVKWEFDNDTPAQNMYKLYKMLQEVQQDLNILKKKFSSP